MVKELTKLFGKGLGRLRLLPVDYYSSHTVEVARDLIGKIIVTCQPSDPVSTLTAGRIIETEAYRAQDPASHCAKGKTPRCAIMFGPPGVAYVYFIYGMYEMLNFVTEPDGKPGAVLIRAIEPIFGIELMKMRRGSNHKDP